MAVDIAIDLTDTEHPLSLIGSITRNLGVNIRGVCAYQTSTDFLYEQGTFPDLPRIDATAWTDTEFVDGALKQLGVYPNVDDPGRSIQ